MPTLPGYAWLGSDAETFGNETVYPTPTVSQLLETTTPGNSCFQQLETVPFHCLGPLSLSYAFGPADATCETA